VGLGEQWNGKRAGRCTHGSNSGRCVCGPACQIEAIDAEPVERIGPEGDVLIVDAALHILVTVRPHAPIQMLFTGHMDTVFGADHPFKTARPSPIGILDAPGADDMKGGLAVRPAALSAIDPWSVSVLAIRFFELG